MKILGYQVVSGYHHFVATEVVRLSNEGWILHGEPHFEPYRDSSIYGVGGGGGGNSYHAPTVYQTMILVDSGYETSRR